MAQNDRNVVYFVTSSEDEDAGAEEPDLNGEQAGHFCILLILLLLLL
jgi:hypothetical protein